MDRQMDEWTDRLMYGQTDRCMDRQMAVWTDRQMNGQTDGCMDYILTLNSFNSSVGLILHFMTTG
ncbi:UNVERIFIED_CONTAM: hypothetical protein FKN15_051661 [Acipenser sinensis]